jgi:hypothetical protein
MATDNKIHMATITYSVPGKVSNKNRKPMIVVNMNGSKVESIFSEGITWIPSRNGNWYNERNPQQTAIITLQNSRGDIVPHPLATSRDSHT